MNIKYLTLIFAAVVMGLVSCKNNDEVFAPVAPSTGFTLINASADTLNFYLNGTRQNKESSIYPGGSPGLQLEPSGQQNYQFKKSGQPDYLFSLPLNLTANTFNSIYVTGESASKIFKTVDTIPQIDSLSAVRFVNAAPDAGDVDVFVGDTVNFKSRPFKSSSVFLLTGSGEKTVTVYLSGSPTAQIDTVITFQPAVSYTLFTKGVLNGKGSSAFSLGVLINQLTAY